MKRAWKFFFNYRLFGFALVAFIAALILQFTKHSHIADWVLGVVAIIETLPLLWEMLQELRQGTYGIDILAATAIVSSVLLSQYWAGMIIVLMLTGGEALEDYAEHRAKTELDSLLSSAPQIAHLLHGQKVVDIKVSEVKTGNRINIRPGEIVPVDSIIIEGTSSFDEASLTGESLPQEKTVNSDLLSGSINLDGVITAQALRPAADSQYEQIIKMVKAASNSQSPFVRLADRYSIPFTVVSFAIAIASWVVSGQSIRFLEVLVVATPCPLILAAPIAVISGMSRSARAGIIVKTGSSLEKLAEAKTIGFDKTGTLTRGKPAVKRVTTLGNHKIDEVLRLAASLELNSNHVLAKAIVSEAKRKGIKPPKAKQIKEFSGIGLEANVSGRLVMVGRLSLMQEQKVIFPKNYKKTKQLDTSTYVAINNTLAGVITFDDKLRPEAKSTILRLRELGLKKILMVTGDNVDKAREVAKQIGIKDYSAAALPADKLHIVEAITDRPVVFVGDGINDAPVLTVSDVGIALGARGKSAASESADMVIMLDDISKVATAREIAKRTFFIAQQSIIVGIALSLVLMLVFSTGHFKPIYGAVIQEVVDVIVIFNALRAHGEWNKKKATT